MMETSQTVAAAGEGFDYGAMVEHLPVLVWTATPNGALDFVCGKTCRYFDRTFAQMIEWGWAAVVHPDDLEAVGEHWSRSLETGEPYGLAFRLRRASDGEYRRFIVRATAHRDESGRITRWFGCAVDVGELAAVAAIPRPR